MSVIVKGMEMPKNCLECIFKDVGTSTMTRCVLQKEWVKYKDDNCTPKQCPLIELPSHGRLIDADKLVTIFKGISEAEAQIHGHGWNFTMRCINEIENASTVLEEEEE